MGGAVVGVVVVAVVGGVVVLVVVDGIVVLVDGILLMPLPPWISSMMP